MVSLAQTLFYVVSPLVTLLAVLIAYLALLKQSKPHILVYYQINPDIQSIIDLVIENVGNGMAREVRFSQPLPAQCYGIEQADRKPSEVLGNGFPAIAAGQKYVFTGGQYGGLSAALGDELEIKVTYKYRSPIGINSKRTEVCVLSVSHLESMPTRQSAESAIVDALKGPNTTTLQKMERELRSIGRSLDKIASEVKISKESENA